MAMTQHLDLFAGEDRELTLAGRDEFGLPVDLTDKTIDWRIGRRPCWPDGHGAIVSKTATVLDAPMGLFSVQVAADDTTDMDGDYEHMATASDSVSRAVICHGRFRVRPVLS